MKVVSLVVVGIIATYSIGVAQDRNGEYKSDRGIAFQSITLSFTVSALISASANINICVFSSKIDDLSETYVATRLGVEGNIYPSQPLPVLAFDKDALLVGAYRKRDAHYELFMGVAHRSITDLQASNQTPSSGEEDGVVYKLGAAALVRASVYS